MAWGPPMPCSNALSNTSLSGHTHMYVCKHSAHRDLCLHTHAHTLVRPHSPAGAWAVKSGHMAQEGPWCLGWGGERMALARVARQPVPIPSPQAWTTSTRPGRGRAEGSARALRPALHLGTAGGYQVLSSGPRGRCGAPARPGWAGPASQPEQLPEERAGVGKRGWRAWASRSPRWTLLTPAHSIWVWWPGPVGHSWAVLAACPSGWQSQGQGGGGTEKLTGWGLGSGGPGRLCGKSSLRAGPGTSTVLLRGSTGLHLRPYLAGEHQAWHLPPRGSDVVGDKGNSKAENPALTSASPRGRATAGLTDTRAPAQRASSGLDRAAGHSPAWSRVGLSCGTSVQCCPFPGGPGGI